MFNAFLNNLIDKKSRTFLVLFSIAISAAIIFANESFARTVAQAFHNAGIRWSGNSDLVVSTKKDIGAEEWINLDKLSSYTSGFEYAQRTIREQAFYQSDADRLQYFTLLGVDIDEFNQRNPLTLIQGSMDNWTGNRVIIGTAYADRYHMKVGDTVKLELNNEPFDFTIAGIAAPKGLFIRETADGGYLLAPRQTIAAISGGESNLLFIKLKDRLQVETVKNDLTSTLTDYNVEYGINDTMTSAEAATYVLPFRVSSMAVLFMCIFIIFTAFNLLTLERIPLVGILRNIGCTRKKINIALTAESAILGVIGGLMGCALGIGVLLYLKYTYGAGDEIVASAPLTFGFPEILKAVCTAVVITVASAMIPILRLTKITIKNIILSDFTQRRTKSTKWWIFGVASMIACLVVPGFLPHNLIGMIASCALATLAIAGLIPLIPFLTRQISKASIKIPGLRAEVQLGIRNVRDSKSLMNSIQLFASAIAIVAFMASLFSTMGTDLVRVWDGEVAEEKKRSMEK